MQAATGRFDHPRYLGRTVEWGHWSITFMERQIDPAKNYGDVVGRLNHGTNDGTVGSTRRLYLQKLCDEWVANGDLPGRDNQFVATKAALAKLTPAQLDQVLVQTRLELEAFIHNEWIPTKKNAAGAEAFHASVRVHSFGWAS